MFKDKTILITGGSGSLGQALTKQDEIGIHFKESLKANLQPKSAFWLQVLKITMKKNPRNRYLVNINPRNTRMKNFLKNVGFELIQHTYEVSKKD